MRFQGARARQTFPRERVPTHLRFRRTCCPLLLGVWVCALRLLRGRLPIPAPGQQHPHHVGRPRREPADLGGHREVVAYRVMLGDRVVVDGEATVTGGLLSTD